MRAFMVVASRWISQCKSFNSIAFPKQERINWNFCHCTRPLCCICTMYTLTFAHFYYTYRFCVPAVQRFQYSECDCDENAPNWSLLCHTKHISFTNDFWSHRKMLPTIQLLFQKPSIENVPKNRTFNCIAAPKWALQPLQKNSD